MQEYADFAVTFSPVEDDTSSSDLCTYRIGVEFHAGDSASTTTLIEGSLSEACFNMERLQAISLDLAIYGEALSAMLFADPRLKAALATARAYSDAQQIPLRVTLRMSSSDQLLHSLCWETLVDPTRGGRLSLGDRVRLVRQSSTTWLEPVAPITQAPLSMLVAVAAPDDLDRYNLAAVEAEGEVERIQNAMSGMTPRALTRTNYGHPIGLTAIAAALQEHTDILYLICHGIKRDGETYLWLEGPECTAERVSGAALIEQIALLHKRPTLIVLLACYSGGSGVVGAGDMSPLGPRLARLGIPAVLVMQGSLTVESAHSFTDTLLRELLRDGDLERAVALARSAIQDRPDWWTPVLYLNLDARRFIAPVALPPPPCPYPGMRPFQDSRYFYGREESVRVLLQELRLRRRILIIGPSGSGKSSLIRAGILPGLTSSSFFPASFWRVLLPLRLSNQPLVILNEVLGNIANLTTAVTALLASQPGAERLLLVIDQFEDLFALTDPAIQREVITFLQRVYQEPRCTLVLVMRADFYPDLMSSALWEDVREQRHEIWPLRGNALREAIERPAVEVGVTLDSDLSERLLADAASEPGALPLLQETMRLLWARMPGRQLQLEDYYQLGLAGQSGIAFAIAAHANSAMDRLVLPDQQMIAQRIFVRLIQFGEGRTHTRRQQTLSALRAVQDDRDVFDATLQSLVDDRLLTLGGDEQDQQDDQRTVDMAHEILIESWPRLKGWIDQYKASELSRRHYEDQAADWERLGKSDGGLLDRVELQEIDQWRANSSVGQIDHSVLLDKLIKRSRESLERASRRERGVRRFRSIAIAAIVLLTMGVLVAIIIGSQQVAAEQNRRRQAAEISARIALARELAAQAQITIENRHPQRAVLLATEALSVTHTFTQTLPAVDEALHASLDAIGGTPLGTTTASIAVFSPNSRWLVTGHNDGSAMLWDLTVSTRSPVQVLKHHSTRITTAVISGDNHWLLPGSSDGEISRWDLSKQPDEKPTSIFHTTESGPSPGVSAIGLSHDGLLLLVGDDSGSLSVWDLQKADKRPSYQDRLDTDGSTPIQSITLSDDTRWVAVQLNSQRTFLIDFVNGELARFDGATASALSSDGKKIVLGFKMA